MTTSTSAHMQRIVYGLQAIGTSGRCRLLITEFFPIGDNEETRRSPSDLSARSVFVALHNQYQDNDRLRLSSELLTGTQTTIWLYCDRSYSHRLAGAVHERVPLPSPYPYLIPMSRPRFEGTKKPEEPVVSFLYQKAYIKLCDFRV